jgi:hypothetical protein
LRQHDVIGSTQPDPLLLPLCVQDVAELARLKILGSKLKKSAARKEPPSVVLQAMQQQRQVAEGSSGPGGTSGGGAPAPAPAAAAAAGAHAGQEGQQGNSAAGAAGGVCYVLLGCRVPLRCDTRQFLKQQYFQHSVNVHAGTRLEHVHIFLITTARAVFESFLSFVLHTHPSP